ncbi:MAG: hypothetical protein DRP72_01480, partial [Candidatus Omnitrophota bacterium]
DTEKYSGQLGSNFYKDLSSYCQDYGIKDIHLREIKEIKFLPEGTVKILSDGTAIDSVKYSSQEAYPERPKTIYIFAKDPTAKEILTIAPSSDTQTKTTINLWWLKNSAPFGILPGSMMLNPEKNLLVRYIYARLSENGIVYKIEGHPVLVEEEYTFDGQLFRQKIKEVKHYFKEEPFVIKDDSFEEIYYDPAVSWSKALYSKVGSEIRKEWVAVVLGNENGKYYSYCIVKEHEAAAPQRVRYYVYYYDVYGRFMGKDIFYDPLALPGLPESPPFLSKKNNPLSEEMNFSRGEPPTLLTKENVQLSGGEVFYFHHLWNIFSSPLYILLILLASFVIVSSCYIIGKRCGLGKLLKLMNKWKKLKQEKGELFVKHTSKIFKTTIENLENIRRELQNTNGELFINEAIEQLEKKQNLSEVSVEDIVFLLKIIEETMEKVIKEVIINFYNPEEEEKMYDEIKGDEVWIKKAFVRRLKNNLSYYLPLLDNFSYESLASLEGYGADLRGFERWLKQAGIEKEKEKERIETFLKTHPFLSLILLEMMVDEIGHNFRTESKNVRYYYLYKFLCGKNIYQIRKEREKIEAFLKKNDSLKETKKKSERFITEDMEEIFQTVEKAEKFLSKIDNKSENFEELLKDFKPKKDTFGSALSNCWAPLALIIIFDFFVILMNWFFPNLPFESFTVPLLGITLPFPSIIISIFMTAFFMGCMVLFNWINTRGDKSEPLSTTFSKYKGTSIYFWSWTAVVLIFGFLTNLFMISWSMYPISEFWGAGIIGYSFSVTLLVLDFFIILFTFYSFAYFFQEIWSWYAAKEIGKGEIKIGNFKKYFDEFKRVQEKIEKGTWHLAGKKNNAEGNFIDHLGTKESREEYFKNLWEKFLEILFVKGEIDKKAKEWLEGWLSNKEFKKPQEKMTITEEGKERIQRFIEGWLMDLPPALQWLYIVPVGVYISGRGYRFWHKKEGKDSWEELQKEYEEENLLNLFIRKYREEWENFVENLEEIIKILAKKNIGIEENITSIIKIPKKVKEELLSLKGKERVDELAYFRSVLDESIQKYIKEAILYWAVRRASWQPAKQIYEAVEIADIFKEFTKMCFPNNNQKDYEENINYLVGKKVQIVLNEVGKNPPDKLYKVIERYPQVVEIVDKEKETLLYGYNSNKKRMEILAYIPPSNHVAGGKVGGQAKGFPFIRILFPIYTDTNSGFRFEEAMRLPFSLSLVNEFVTQHDYTLTTDFLSYGEKIFHKQLTVEGKASNWSDETWTTVVQRFLSRCDPRGGVSFYGHPGGAHPVIMRAINAQPPDRPSEDIVFGWRMWKNGFRTHLAQHIIFDKQRPPSFLEDTNPKTKFSAGAGDLLNSVIKELMTSKYVSLPQRYIQLFSISFFSRKPFIYLLQLLYLWSIIFTGFGIYIGFPYFILFGIYGILLSQAITIQLWGLLVEKFGFWRGTKKFLLLMPLNFIYFVPLIGPYAIAHIGGLKSLAEFKATEKAPPLTWEKVFELRKLKLTDPLILSLILSAVILISFYLLPLPLLYRFLISSLLPAVAIIYFGSYACKEVNTEKEKAWLKFSISASILVLFSWVIPGILLWQTFQIIWSITYVLFPVISILTPFLLRPVLGIKIYNAKGKLALFVIAQSALLVFIVLFMNGVLNYLFNSINLNMSIFGIRIAGIITGLLVFMWINWEVIFKELMQIGKNSRKIKKIKIENLPQKLSTILDTILNIQDANQRKQTRENELAKLAEEVYKNLEKDKKEDYIK